jgi:cytoplasmic tRNA 2-thiolation protein 1
MYAYYKKLDYFSTECIYSPNAYRGYARAFLKDLEAIRPAAILDIIHSGEAFTEVQTAVQSKMPQRNSCERCGYMASGSICKACLLLEGLNKGLPRLGVGQTDKLRKRHQQLLDTATAASGEDDKTQIQRRLAQLKFQL